MKGKIELYNISFLILKVELHFKGWSLASSVPINAACRASQFIPSCDLNPRSHPRSAGNKSPITSLISHHLKAVI